MLITSVNNIKIKDIIKLKSKKYRDNNKQFFVEGVDLVKEAYKCGLLQCLYILDGKPVLYDDIPYNYVSSDVMKKISEMESISDYFGICKMKNEKTIGNKIIALDEVQDPGNLGTIIRSAVAFKFDTIVLGKGCVDLYNPKVVRSSKGMLFNVNIISRDLDTFLRKLDGYKIYGTDVTSGTSIRDEIIPEKVAIVLGNEGQGISENVRKLCDKFLYIEMNSECESLNVGVCASILMYEVMKK